MPLTVYFIGDDSQRRSARAIPVAFIDRDERYSPLDVAIPNRRSIVAINDPSVFDRFDTYMCAHGLYDKGNVTILDGGEGVLVDKSLSETVVVLTDSLELARDLKRQDAS